MREPRDPDFNVGENTRRSQTNWLPISQKEGTSTSTNSVLSIWIASTRLKGFVKFCLKKKWLDEDIAEDLKAPPKTSELNPKTPFDDEELERIYAACDKIGAATNPGPRYRTWEERTRRTSYICQSTR
jgi:hypothetical protein